VHDDGRIRRRIVAIERQWGAHAGAALPTMDPVKKDLRTTETLLANPGVTMDRSAGIHFERTVVRCHLGRTVLLIRDNGLTKTANLVDRGGVVSSTGSCPGDQDLCRSRGHPGPSRPHLPFNATPHPEYRWYACVSLGSYGIPATGGHDDTHGPCLRGTARRIQT